MNLRYFVIAVFVLNAWEVRAERRIVDVMMAQIESGEAFAGYRAQVSRPAGQTTRNDAVGPSFWLVNGAYVGSVAADVESTFYALERCPGGCYEANPLIRPMVERGRPLTYAVSMGLASLTVWGSHHLKQNGKWYWWVPPVIGIAAHSYAAQHNFRLAR